MHVYFDKKRRFKSVVLIYFLQMNDHECSRNHLDESQQPKTIIVKEFYIQTFTTG